MDILPGSNLQMLSWGILLQCFLQGMSWWTSNDHVGKGDSEWSYLDYFLKDPIKNKTKLLQILKVATCDFCHLFFPATVALHILLYESVVSNQRKSLIWTCFSITPSLHFLLAREHSALHFTLLNFWFSVNVFFCFYKCFSLKQTRSTITLKWSTFCTAFWNSD